MYLLGGSAMMVKGLKDQTEDIDLAVGVASEFEHVYIYEEAEYLGA